MKQAAARLQPDLPTKLIIFPGYAAVLIGWLGLAGWLVYSIVATFLPKATSPVPQVQPAVTGSVNSALTGGAIVGGVILGALVLLAIWFYVSSWTKQLVDWLGVRLHVTADHYWAYCTILLASVWTLNALLAALFGDELAGAAAAFVAAAAIFCGSVSFGMAALCDRVARKKAGR